MASPASRREAAIGGVQDLANRIVVGWRRLLDSVGRKWSAMAFAEQMFIVSRLLTVPGVLMWLWFNPSRDRLFDGVVRLVVFFAIYNVTVHLATLALSAERLRRFQFLEVICDLVFITLLLNETGTMGGMFQFGYILLIVFSSYYFRMRSALILVAVTFGLSLLLSTTGADDVYWGDMALLAGFEILVAVGIGVMVRRDRREREGMDNLNRELQMKTAELTQAYGGILSSWASAVDAKDTYTRGHAERVSELARAIAEAMRLPADECGKIAVAALLHDVGKLAVPDAILGKPASLTGDEWLVIRQHPQAGAEMISQVEPLKEIAPLIRSHHERADGSGYPSGASLDSIPLGARIIAVADVYDAMTSERNYRRALRHDDALKELVDGSGDGFDAEVVKAFMDVAARMPRRPWSPSRS